MIWLWLACSEVDPDFPLDRANAICARYARCELLTTAGFTSEEACRAALRQAAEDQIREDGLPCARWDADAAEACLAAYDGSCESPPALGACTEVCGD